MKRNIFNHKNGFQLALYFLLVVFLYGCDTSSGSAVTHHEARMSIEQEEALYPQNYLLADGTYRESFLGGEFVIKGNIFNQATHVDYKDVVIEINYYSQTETLIDTERYVLYKHFPTNHTIPFELRVKKPAAAKQLGWRVIDAAL